MALTSSLIAKPGSGSGSGSGGTGTNTIIDEFVPIAATNILPDLANTTADNTVRLFINGKSEDSSIGGAVTVSGAALTWDNVQAGYDIGVSDRITATYNKG